MNVEYHSFSLSEEQEGDFKGWASRQGWWLKYDPPMDTDIDGVICKTITYVLPNGKEQNVHIFAGSHLRTLQ